LFKVHDKLKALEILFGPVAKNETRDFDVWSLSGISWIMAEMVDQMQSVLMPDGPQKEA
jgi:hypothetical protein